MQAKLLGKALPLVGHADAVSEHHFAALPAGEYKHEDDDAREDHASRHYGGAAMLKPRIPVKEREQQRDAVADCVHPRVGQVADAVVAKDFDKAGYGGDRGRNEPNAEEPERGRRPELV